MFSLSFRSFLSLFIRNKRERKGHVKKTYYFKIVLLIFLLYCDKRRKSKQKEEKRTVFYALTSVNKMDVAGKPALSRSLKKARGAIVVHFIKIILNNSVKGEGSSRRRY